MNASIRGSPFWGASSRYASATVGIGGSSIGRVSWTLAAELHSPAEVRNMKRLAVLLAVAMFAAAGHAQGSDAALRRVTEADRAARTPGGKLPVMPAAEHLSRAETYMANRLFPQAREHWAIYMESYPQDAGMPKALFGTARSYMWEREYGKAVEWFDRLTRDHPMTKDGREGLAFKGASYVRAGRNMEAVKAYEQYTVMFPQGERIESAHLNIIDALREAGEYDDANAWVAPIFRAVSRLRAMGSTTTTYLQPAPTAPWTALMPSPPMP